MQSQFAGVLRDLCISDEIAAEIHAPAASPRSSRRRRRHYDADDVQAAVAGALRNLSELDEIAQDISGLGGIEVLVDAARATPTT